MPRRDRPVDVPSGPMGAGVGRPPAGLERLARGRPGRDGAAGRPPPRSEPVRGAGRLRSAHRGLTAAVDRPQPVGRGHDGLGSGVLEHPQAAGGSGRSNRSHRRHGNDASSDSDPEMTIHAATMMITRTTGINSSTYLPCRKTLTRGNSTVVDGRGTTAPTVTTNVWFRQPSPGCVATIPTPGDVTRSTRRHRPRWEPVLRRPARRAGPVVSPSRALGGRWCGGTWARRRP